MRYCSRCKMLHAGRPMFCPSCGRTWNYRLCERGHENSINHHANYCAVCGSPNLTEGMREVWWSKLLGLFHGRWRKIVLIGIGVFLLASFGNMSGQFFEFVVGIAVSVGVLGIAMWLVLAMIPNWVRRALRLMWRGIWGTNKSRGQNRA